jgi:hypothetical protein
MFNRRRLPGGGLAVEKLYVEESDDNHSGDRAPEDYIGSSIGAAFAHENIGGAYHQHKVAEEHPERPCQNRQYSTLLIDWLISWGRHNPSPKKIV